MRVINQFIIALGNYTCMYIHVTNQEIYLIYNDLLLNYLWSCVL